MPYVLSAVAAHTNPASARTSIGRPRRPSASEPFLPRPSAHVLSCHLASFVRIRPAPPNRSCNLQRARLCCGRRFFFFSARRARAPCAGFSPPPRDHSTRHGVSIKACAHARRFPRACCCFHRRVVRTYMATRHVRLAPRGKGRAKCVCRLYVYADQKWGHGACVSLSICSHTEITYIYWAVYSCVCVCMYGSMGRETVWHALWFQEAGGR